jgi:hypothetical protein
VSRHMSDKDIGELEDEYARQDGQRDADVANQAIQEKRLRERARVVLGWELGQVSSFYLQQLRDVVRPLDSTLAKEMGDLIAWKERT